MNSKIKTVKLLINNLFKDVEAKSIVKNIGWLFFDKILRYGVGIFVSIWVANYLGAARFGNYNVAIAYMFIFSAVASLGLKGVVTRELVKRPDEENVLLGSSFILTLLGGVFAFLSSILTAYIINPNDQESIQLVTVVSASFLFQATQVISYYYNAKVLAKYTVYASNASYVLSSALKIYGIWTAKNLIFFAWIVFIDTAVTGLFLMLFYLRHKEWKIYWTTSFELSKELIAESLPLVLSGIMVSIYMKVDQIMLKELSTEKEAGLYAVAVKLTELWYFVPVIIQSSVFPNITKAIKSDRKFLISKFERLFGIMSIFSFSIILSVLLFGGFVIRHLFTDEYLGSLPILHVSIFSLLFVSLGVARNSYLLIEKMTIYTLYFTFAGAVINVLMNWYLIPAYGGIGASYSTIFSYAISALFTTFFIKELRPIGWLMIKSLYNPKFKA